MSNAPERIWAFYAPEIAENENGATIVAHEAVQHGAAPYIRADIHDAEIARLRAKVDAADMLAAVLPTYGFECEAGRLTRAQPWIDFVEAINDRV